MGSSVNQQYIAQPLPILSTAALLDLPQYPLPAALELPVLGLYLASFVCSIHSLFRR